MPHAFSSFATIQNPSGLLEPMIDGSAPYYAAGVIILCVLCMLFCILRRESFGPTTKSFAQYKFWKYCDGSIQAESV